MSEVSNENIEKFHNGEFLNTILQDHNSNYKWIINFFYYGIKR